MSLRIGIFVFGAVLQTALWVAVLAIDPFGMSSAADRASESIFLKLYSFAYPSFAPARTRDDSVVVLYDDNDLPRYDSSGAKPQWPLPSKTHAELLRRILAMGPKAVFVDILFDSDRALESGGTAEVLLRAIPQRAAPVFFATMAKGNSDKLVPGLQALPTLRPEGALVSAPAYRAVVEFSAKPNHYALESQGELTAAAALYEIAAKDAPRSYPSIGKNASDEMLVVWGSTLASKYKAFPDQFPGCALYFDDRSGRIGGLFHALKIALFSSHVGEPQRNSDWDRLQPCSYQDTISAADFFPPPNAPPGNRLSDQIAGRFVFVGARIVGIPDEIVSPVNGKLPGVYLHAMAFDNLLSFRGNPIHSTSSYHPLQALLIFAALVIGGLLFADDPHPETRGRAVEEIGKRLLAWVGFAVASGVLLFAFLLLHWAPYNWGAVFAISGTAFLSRIGGLMLVVIGLRSIRTEASHENRR